MENVEKEKEKECNKSKFLTEKIIVHKEPKVITCKKIADKTDQVSALSKYVETIRHPHKWAKRKQYKIKFVKVEKSRKNFKQIAQEKIKLKQKSKRKK